MCTTYSVLGTPACILYIVCSYVDPNPVLVADDDTTSAVSPTRRGAPRNDVWNAESPKKRQCLPWSVGALARLPKHNNRPRFLRVVNSGIYAPQPVDLGGVESSSSPPNDISSLSWSISNTSDLAASVLSLLLGKKLSTSSQNHTLGGSRRIHGRGNYVFEF